jgi:UDP-N-acetylmuramate--alanine ligase
MYENKKIHFIGIGGISMSGLALMVLDHHATVSGSDITESELTDKLEKIGCIIKYGHHPELIDDADIVVYTAAVHDDDPELMRAKELNKETYERADFLGLITKEYKNCICISGTHGKSTTTGMTSLAFLKSGLNPTIHIGAILEQINSNTKIGSKDYLVMEACEYVDSFLAFHPTSEIILNIDDDHLDYFKNVDNIKKSFRKFTSLLPNDGFVVLNIDDENAKTLEDVDKKVITYGVNNDANYRAKNIEFNDLGCAMFDIYLDDKYLTHLNINVMGEHNVYNALASFALSHQYINDINSIKEGIEDYRGVKRRFELIKVLDNGIKIYDDYAHHPTEVMSTLKTSKGIKCHESWAVFQSHTFSRTAAHLKELADILKQFDHVVIAKIYPAREINTFGISEEMIVDEIKKDNPNVIYIDDFDKIVDYLEENVKDNDLVITIGAGPIDKVAHKYANKN